VLAGQVMRRWSGGALTVRLLAGGAALWALGLLMHPALPINKNLWTSSYAVFMAGWAMALLAVFHWLIDVRGWSRWAAPLVIYGTNALVMFISAGVIGKLFYLIKWTGADGQGITLKGYIYQQMFVPLASPVNASLLFALAFVLVHFGFAWFLWRRKWFVKI
jgi:predicted acyltransferase